MSHLSGDVLNLYLDDELASGERDAAGGGSLPEIRYRLAGAPREEQDQSRRARGHHGQGDQDRAGRLVETRVLSVGNHADHGGLARRIAREHGLSDGILSWP